MNGLPGFLRVLLLCWLAMIRLPAVTPTNPLADPLDRGTPRSAVRAFLDVCHQGRFVTAAQYLDLSRIPKTRRLTEGPELARQLGMLLDRNMDFEVEQLDNTPDGNPADGLGRDIDQLARFSLDGRAVPLYLQRETQDGTSVWLVSADSVARIPQLSANSQGPTIEKHLPAPLVDIKLLGTPVWAWVGIVLLGLFLAVGSRALTKLAVAILRPLAQRYAPWLGGYRLSAFGDPLRLLVAVAVFRACLDAFAPSALLRVYLLSTLTLLAVLGTASIVMRTVDVVSDQMISRLDLRERTLTYSVIPLGVRFVKICIFITAVLVVLDQWGVRITTILAGLGVGGLAVALAAQKTLENLFGGISIITDRPVLVGDVCQFGGQSGTVVDIGLRSTRIRTSERTIVTIPNAQFSTMTIENLSRRDRILFKPALQVRRDTPAAQLRALMESIEQMLRNHPKVDPTDQPVRFVAITPESFRLEIFAYVLTADANQFLQEQTALLLTIVDLAEAAGVRFAVPFQESLTPSAAGAST